MSLTFPIFYENYIMINENKLKFGKKECLEVFPVMGGIIPEGYIYVNIGQYEEFLDDESEFYIDDDEYPPKHFVRTCNDDQEVTSHVVDETTIFYLNDSDDVFHLAIPNDFNLKQFFS